MSSAETKILVPFSGTVARLVYPAMARAGLRRKGKRIWWERHDDGSWVILEIQLSKWTTRTQLGFTVNTIVWPPGTWERQQAAHESFAGEDVPSVGSGPISQRPAGVAAERWPWPEFREIDLSANFTQVGDELREVLLIGLDWGRSHSDVEGALRTMGIPFGLNNDGAIIMLRAAAPHHPRLPSLVDSFTTRWRSDPRPITMRDEIQLWRAEVGLPPLENLPWYWHVAMLPNWIEQYGWPGAAFKIGLDSEFSLADGTTTRVPPPDWPNPQRQSR